MVFVLLGTLKLRPKLSDRTEPFESAKIQLLCPTDCSRTQSTLRLTDSHSCSDSPCFKLGTTETRHATCPVSSVSEMLELEPKIPATGLVHQIIARLILTAIAQRRRPTFTVLLTDPAEARGIHIGSKPCGPSQCIISRL